MGLSKSTVSRLLSTLASQGFVLKDAESQKYRLGLSIFQLNSIMTSNLEIYRDSQPTLKKHMTEVEETLNL
ncbi:helix-turn-helix domain-containing protein [Bacillus sp. V3-13]|uniref:helix-turn-helix domain-containing protein n=1 Tax=Bacillus sp. V3-13 TaxID=2053728 RepID=UPI0035B567A3